MGYKVIHAFSDMQDFHHIYSVGDVFPRTGLEVSEERIQELLGKSNKQGQSLIAKTDGDFSKHMNPPQDEIPFVTVPRGKTYTKTEINRMSTAELRNLAKTQGIDNAENVTGGELKKILIDKFRL